MKIAPYLLTGCLLATIWACKSDKGQVVPPEEVIRQYQSLIDSNRFEEAKMLSTLAEQKRLDEEAAIIAMLPADSTVIRTRFLQINCHEVSNHLVVCECLMEDEEAGEFEAVFHLIKENGAWRVDVPQEEMDTPHAPASSPPARPMALPQRL